ncbi:hypothetical protein DFH06DRAFT_1137434 [Mycena polygramma]|nr:hypothetical protein DFH06DRAFT_1137434 [Mycena polygramma]
MFAMINGDSNFWPKDCFSNTKFKNLDAMFFSHTRVVLRTISKHIPKKLTAAAEKLHPPKNTPPNGCRCMKIHLLAGDEDLKLLFNFGSTRPAVSNFKVHGRSLAWIPGKTHWLVEIAAAVSPRVTETNIQQRRAGLPHRRRQESETLPRICHIAAASRSESAADTSRSAAACTMTAATKCQIAVAKCCRLPLQSIYTCLVAAYCRCTKSKCLLNVAHDISLGPNVMRYKVLTCPVCTGRVEMSKAGVTVSFNMCRRI